MIDEMQIADDLMVIAGDNFFTYSLKEYVDFFHEKNRDCVCVKVWEDEAALSQFGIALLDENGRVLDSEEKPAKPKSNTVVFAAIYKEKKPFPCLPHIWRQAISRIPPATSRHGSIIRRRYTPIPLRENATTSGHRKAIGKYANYL